MHETIQSQHFMSSNQKDFIEQMKKSGKIERSIYYDSSIYQELIATINEGQIRRAPVVSSRYSLVLATSKRARQIIGGAEPLVK